MRMLPENERYRNMLDRALEAMPLAPLDGKCVLITGATGLIASALADLFIHHNRHGGSIRVLAAGRSGARVAQRFGDGAEFVPYDAAAPFTCGVRADYVVHAAGVASPEKYVSAPAETLAVSYEGTKNMLSWARECGSEMLYVSSSEVYGSKPRAGLIAEGDYGAIDPTAVRSSYPAGKLVGEALCTAWRAQYGARVKIARPGHIYGPTAHEGDRRVSSEFPYLASRGEPLVMKSTGQQQRSYCHCLDCATALAAILLRGEDGAAYNISNPEAVITIRQMAEIVARAGGVELRFSLPEGVEKAAFNPMVQSSLDAARLLGLGWQPLFGAEEGFSQTVAILLELRSGYPAD